MLEKTLKALEFSKILSEVASRASSVPAREEIMELRPFQNPDYIRELLEEVAEADKIAFEYSANLSFAFDDISAVLDKAEVMSVLTMGELLRVARMLRVAYSVKSTIAKVPDDSLTRLKKSPLPSIPTRNLKKVSNKPSSPIRKCMTEPRKSFAPYDSVSGRPANR